MNPFETETEPSIYNRIREYVDISERQFKDRDPTWHQVYENIRLLELELNSDGEYE